ncbi:MAG: hypoxanthine phosphoribosyltransferase [Bacteroidota bacterium]
MIKFWNIVPLSSQMEKVVAIHDKKFSLYIDELTIQSRINELSHTLEKDYRNKDLILICILNGAFMFAADLAKVINVDIEVSFVKVSSYVGTESTGKVDELIGLTADLKGKHVLIIEDIVDTGLTIDKVIFLLQDKKPENIEICTLLYKPEAFVGKHLPKYVGFDIPNKFVVGYGLDYNELGRNLKEIYQLKPE